MSNKQILAGSEQETFEAKLDKNSLDEEGGGKIRMRASPALRAHRTQEHRIIPQYGIFKKVTAQRNRFHTISNRFEVIKRHEGTLPG